MVNNQEIAKISKDRMDNEAKELFGNINEKVKLISSEHKFFSNLWGENDIPEVKWFTVAKRQVLNNKENNVFKDDVQEQISDVLLGWTDSINELKASLDTVIYSMKKIESSAKNGVEISKDDYINFLTHRVIALSLLMRLSILVPEVIDPVVHKKIEEIRG